MTIQKRAFISYSRANKDFALKLAEELRAVGLNIWLDQLDIPTGARWDDEVEKGLRDSDVFMVILTQASIASENVKDEIGYAIDSGKRILPVLLETADIPLRLRRFQYVDFTGKTYDEGVEAAKQMLASYQGIPLSETPVSASEPRKKTVRPKVGRPQPLPKGILFGGIAVLLVAVIVTMILLVTKNGPAGHPQATNTVQEFQGPTASPTPNRPYVLSAAEAEQLADAEEILTINGYAHTIYSDDEINAFYDTDDGAVPVTLNPVQPLAIVFAWCATSQGILDENWDNLDIVFRLDNRTIPSASYATKDLRDGDLYCRRTMAIITGWTPGTYELYQSMEILHAINDGTSDYDPYYGWDRYIVTVP